MDEKKLHEEIERLSWVMAGMSTAALGYLKPHESYADQPIAQIEEIVRLRTAFAMACEAIAPFWSTARGKHMTANDIMCEMLRAADINIARLRSLNQTIQ